MVEGLEISEHELTKLGDLSSKYSKIWIFCQFELLFLSGVISHIMIAPLK